MNKPVGLAANVALTPCLKPGGCGNVLLSPPWENIESAKRPQKFHDPDVFAAKMAAAYANGSINGHGATREAILADIQRQERQIYGTHPDQLGNTQGKTFWSAAKTILEQVFAFLKPHGVVIWVVKPYVRDKAIVDFPGQWRTLCEHVGFVTLHEHHALLVDSHSEMGLFGEEVEVYRRESKSFFRRIAEKAGSPRIDAEIVLCMRKAGGIGEGILDAAVASPPYAESINSQSHGIDWTKAGPATGQRQRGAGTKHEATLRAQLSYGQTEGQLGAMPPGEPPTSTPVRG